MEMIVLVMHGATQNAGGRPGADSAAQRVLGAINSPLLTTLAPADQVLSDQRVYLLIEGIREALTCVSASLMFVVVIGLLGAVGHRRFPLPNPSAVPR